MNRFVRTPLALLLSAAVVGLAILPAEHVHRSPDPDHPAVIHRHLDGHHSETVSTLDHPDADPQWLDEPYVAACVDSFVPSLTLAGDAPRTEPHRPAISYRIVPDHAPSIHDPPLTSAGLRAPPSSRL